MTSAAGQERRVTRCRHAACIGAVTEPAGAARDGRDSCDGSGRGARQMTGRSAVGRVAPITREMDDAVTSLGCTGRAAEGPAARWRDSTRRGVVTEDWLLIDSGLLSVTTYRVV